MNALLINSYESCLRRGLWAQSFEPLQLHPTEILRRGLYAGLTSERSDFGEDAGETVMALCGDRGMDIDTTKVHVNLYDTAIHHGAIADIVATHLRQDGPWTRPDPVDGWESGAFVGPAGLRRVILSSWWDDERAAAETHSWATLGEMAIYAEPITLEIIILGNFRKGRRHSSWSRGFLHPKNQKLRFKRSAHYGQRDKPFGDNWMPVWREDHDKITREQWLAAMEEDSITEELHLSIPVVLPSRPKLDVLRDLIARKTERLEKLKGVPEPSYSACHNPISPCQFQGCCLETPESQPAVPRFVSICTQDLLAT